MIRAFEAENEWTKNLPTEPGWYFAWTEDDGVFAVELIRFGSRLAHRSVLPEVDSIIMVEKIAQHWFGPVILPSEPSVMISTGVVEGLEAGG